jgi:hypothetical protein
MKARQAFERLGSKYGDTSWVAQARTKLVGFRSGQTGRQTTTVVWSDAKVDPDETISPDGRYISYPDWKTGNLAVHDFQTGTDRALTTDGAWKLGEAEFSEDSAFSRDGKQVTYAWYQKKTNRFELRIVNFTGEPKRESYSRARRCDTSPLRTGRRTANGSQVSLEPENSDARTGEPVRPGMKAVLGLVGVQDGSLRTIRTVEWTGPDTGFGRIQFSPDADFWPTIGRPPSGAASDPVFHGIRGRPGSPDWQRPHAIDGVVRRWQASVLHQQPDRD